jgi:hypothetical protein
MMGSDIINMAMISRYVLCKKKGAETPEAAHKKRTVRLCDCTEHFNCCIKDDT